MRTLLTVITITLLVAGSANGQNRRHEGRHPRFRALLERLDANKDGKLSKEELGNDRLFARLDRNRDGVIDRGDRKTAKRGEGKRAHKKAPVRKHAGQRHERRAARRVR